MKLSRIKLAGLALAASATLAVQANAAFVAYNDGDLLLGFEQTGTSNNLIVNIGSFTNYVSGGSYSNPGVGVVVSGLAVSDLSGTFGASWNSNVQANLVHWGVAGRTADGTTSFGLQQNTLFLTRGRTVVGTQTTPFARYANGVQLAVGDNITNLGFTLASVQSTGNSASAGLLDGSVGWTSYQNNSNSAIGFEYGSNIEQPLTGAATGPTNSVLDLYQLNNTVNTAGTNGVSPGTYLGSFSLSNAGVLTYTAAAVPEPSTYALLALGLGSLVLLRRGKKRSAAVARN